MSGDGLSRGHRIGAQATVITLGKVSFISKQNKSGTCAVDSKYARDNIEITRIMSSGELCVCVCVCVCVYVCVCTSFMYLSFH